MTEHGRVGISGLCRGALICAAIVLSALVYSFRLTSFLHAKEAALAVCLAGMSVAALANGRTAWNGFRAFAPLWALLGLSAVVHLLIVPCRVPSDAVEELVRCGVLLMAAGYAYDLVSVPVWRARILNAILASAVAAAVLALLQYARLLPGLFPTFAGNAQRAYSVFGNQDLLGGYLALAAPLTLHACLSRCDAPSRRSELQLGPAPVTLGALAILIAGLLISGSRTAWLAAAAGGLVVVVFVAAPWRRIARIAGVAVVVAVATAVLAPDATVHRVARTFSHSDVGARARFWIWDGALRMMRRTPLLGVGNGNFAYWSPQYLGAALHAPGGSTLYHDELHATHAHSEPLEIAAEGGVIGVACWLWMILRLMRGRRGTAPPLSPRERGDGGGFPLEGGDEGSAPTRLGAEWGGLTALIVFALFNAPFRSAPHALAGLLLTAMLLATSRVRRSPSSLQPPAYSLQPTASRPLPTAYSPLPTAYSPQPTASRPLPTAYSLQPTAFLLLSLSLAAFVIVCVALPSCRLRAAEDAHLSGQPTLDLYERAVASPWPNAVAYEKYGIALFEAQQYVQAREAFASALQGLDTGGVYLALGGIEAKLGDNSAAQSRLEQCLDRWPSNTEAWILLMRVSPQPERPQILARARPWLDDMAYNRVAAEATDTQPRAAARMSPRSASL